MRILRLGLGALVATAMGVAAFQAPADAAPTVVVKLGARAHLSPTGKTAKVKVTITCKNAIPAPITVRVVQNRSQVVVSGTGTSATNYRCNGRSQTLVVAVPANSLRFNQGGASARATVTVCDANNVCASDSDARNISLR